MTREQFITQVEGSQVALRRFLTALCCGDAALADDIAQESYLKAFVACESLKDVSKFGAWIFRIAYNTFINSKRSERVSDSYDAVWRMAAEEGADEHFRYQALHQALDRLPPKERTSVLLFYMEGYSVREIAEIEETSQDAVKQHLSRGRNHLRGLLTNE